MTCKCVDNFEWSSINYLSGSTINNIEGKIIKAVLGTPTAHAAGRGESKIRNLFNNSLMKRRHYKLLYYNRCKLIRYRFVWIKPNQLVDLWNCVYSSMERVNLLWFALLYMVFALILKAQLTFGRKRSDIRWIVWEHV